MKLLFTGSVLLLFAVGVFAMTTPGENMAAAIVGTHIPAEVCVDAVNERDGSTLSVDAYDVSYARIDDDRKKDIILRNTTATYCGSAGCVFEICLQRNEQVELIPFSYAAQQLTVQDSLTNNMHDITLTGKSTAHLVWDHSRYIHLRNRE